MPPLRLAAIGLLLVLIDIRLGGISLSLDLIGWLMVMGGMHQLAGGNRWFTWSRNLAVVSVATELMLFISPIATLSVMAALVGRLAVLAFVFCLCTGLLGRLGKRDTGYSVTLQVVRVLIPLISLTSAIIAVVGAPLWLPVEWLYPVQLVGTVVLAGLMWLLGSRYSFAG